MELIQTESVDKTKTETNQFFEGVRYIGIKYYEVLLMLMFICIKKTMLVLLRTLSIIQLLKVIYALIHCMNLLKVTLS